MASKIWRKLRYNKISLFMAKIGEKVKELFRKHEYNIGMGELDTSGLFGRAHFDVSEYRFRLVSSYSLAFCAVFGGCMLPAFLFVAPVHIFLMMCIVVIMPAIAATLEPLQKATDLHSRLRKVPKHLKQNAKEAYGLDWRESAIECYEAHIGNECPLCGAD